MISEMLQLPRGHGNKSEKAKVPTSCPPRPFHTLSRGKLRCVKVGRYMKMAFDMKGLGRH